MIEELVKQDGNSVEAVYTSFPGKGRDKLNALVNFIQSLTVGSKLEKKTCQTIPKKRTVYVACRANTGSVENTVHLFCLNLMN